MSTRGNSASRTDTGYTNRNILQNLLFSPQTPKLQTQDYIDPPKNNASSNFNIHEDVNKNDELLIDLSDDDSQNKNENRAQNGNEMRDFFATSNQDQRFEPNLIDLYENILATPQLIHNSVIYKPNTTRGADFGNFTDYTENTENVSMRTKSFSYLDELLNTDVEPKKYVTTSTVADKSIVFNTNVADDGKKTKYLTVDHVKNINDVDKVKRNLFKQDNLRPNIEFQDYADDEAETSYEDIDDIIDEVLNTKSGETLYLKEKYKQRTQLENINTNNNASNEEILPKLNLNDDTKTETSSVEIDDLLNDII